MPILQNNAFEAMRAFWATRKAQREEEALMEGAG